MKSVLIFLLTVGVYSGMLACSSMQSCQPRDFSNDYSQDTGPVCQMQDRDMSEPRARALDAYPGALP